MKNADMTFEVNPNEKAGVTIRFSGKLTVENAPAFRDLLLDNLEKFESFVFETKEVDSLDLSFYQLMISAQKSLLEKHKKCRFNLSLPSVEAQLLKQAGFETNPGQ